MATVNQTKTKLGFLWPSIICGLAALFYVYDYFIQVAPSVMTDQLMRAYAIGAGQLGVLSACFYYSYTLMQIPAGLLLDRLGARKLLTGAVFISACGVTLFGITPIFFVAGISRFLIGLGSSFAFVSAIFLVSRWFDHKHFAMIAGFIQLAGCLGSLIGLAPLAEVVNHFGWRQTMINTGLLTFMMAALFWLVIRDGKAEEEQQQNLTSRGEWSRLKVLLKQPQLWWIALCGLASWVPVAVVGALWGVPYLMRVYGWTNTEAGNWCSIFWLGLGFGSPLVGWISSRYSNRKGPLLFCFIIGALGAMLFMVAPSILPWMTGVALFLMGASASVQSLSFGLVKDIVPSELFGTASGFNNMAAIVGGALSQPLVGLILSWRWTGEVYQNAPVYTVNDYRAAFWILPLAALIGVATVFYKLRETHGERQTNPLHL